MCPEDFRDHVLGRLSSHPYWRARRSVWLRWVAALPLLGVLVLFAMTLSDVLHWIETISNLPLWVIMGAGAFAFGMGFLVTLLLIDRWAYLQGRDDGVAHWSRRMSALRGFPLDPWIFTGALALGMAGPWVLRRFDLLPPYLHLVPELAAFLPLLAMLLALRYLEEHRKPLRWRSIWSLVIALGGALLVLTVVYDLACAWKATALRDSLHSLLGWYADLERPFLSTALLVPLLFALVWIWRFWTEVAPPGETAGHDGSQDAGRWNRLTNYVPKLFGKRPPVQDRLGRLPDWMRALSQSLREDPKWKEAGSPKLAGEPEAFADKEGGKLAEESRYRAYFAGQTPTRAQDLFLTQFNTAYQHALRSPTGVGDGEPMSSDLLIEGAIGTGRTSALVAAATVATGVRGQRVLYLTASAQQTVSVVRRVKELFVHLGVAGFFSCEPITDGNLRRWLAGATPVPNVLVGTPAEIEQLLYGAAVEGALLARLRVLLLALEVVLVDDFGSHALDQSAHLPFIVDKHVLLLASRHIPVQVVVVMPPLLPIARHRVTDRLFRHVTPDRNLFIFEPPPGPVGYGVTLLSDAPQRTFELLNRWLEEREKSPVALRSRTEIGATDAHSDIVLMLGDATDGDEGRASLLDYGSEGAMVITVLPRSEQRQQKRAAIVPLIVERSARPMLLTHLRSVTRFLEPRVPIPLVYWKHFGLDFKSGAGHYPVVPGRREVTVEARFRIDAVPGTLRDQIGHDTWPYLVLEEASTYHRVEPGSVPDPRRRLYKAEQGNEVLLAIGERVNEDHGRRAIWSFRDGEWESDLGYLRPLVVERGGVPFVPDYLAQDPHTKRVHIAPKRAPEGGGQFCFPLVKVGWAIGPNGLAKSTMRGAGFGYALFHLECDPSCRIRLVWQGLLDAFGRAAPISPPVSCDVTSSLSGLLLLPHPMSPETMAADVAHTLTGNWETGSGEAALAEGEYRFWPALTAAFNYAACRSVPEATAWAQGIAFGLGGEAARTARAIIWVIEPEDTGNTASNILRPLLEDDGERKVLFESMLWFLTQLKDHHTAGNGTALAFMRRLARVGYDGDTELEPLDQPMALCQQLVARADRDSYREQALSEKLASTEPSS